MEKMQKNGGRRERRSYGERSGEVIKSRQREHERATETEYARWK